MDPATLALAPPGADAGGERARAFSAARRHSRHVRAYRRTLEMAVLGVFVALAAFTLARNFGRALRDVSFEGVGIEGGRLTMDKPHLTGSRPGGGSYDITAAKAMQDAGHPGAVDLALIGGQIVTADRGASRLFASSGHYESATEALDLFGDVKLLNPKYEIYLKSVHVQFKTGGYVSHEAVRALILPDTQIEADAFEVHDGGAEASFTGHVRTLINARTSAKP